MIYLSCGHDDIELGPVDDDDDDECDGDGDGDLSCGHHRAGTMALHWVASIFLSASPHLHVDDDTSGFVAVPFSHTNSSALYGTILVTVIYGDFQEKYFHVIN